MSDFLVSYEHRIRGRKQPKKLACVIRAIDSQEAKQKVLEKPRKPTERIARLRVSKLA